jgi:hypothetical protein
LNGRRGVGIELKESYYNQMLKNLAEATRSRAINEQMVLV